MSYELIHWAHERIDQADSSASSSIEFVKARLAEYGMPEICTPQNEGDIELLGGRLSDLEVLLQKIRGGSSLHAAVEEIVMRMVLYPRSRPGADSIRTQVPRPRSRRALVALHVTIHFTEQVLY